MHLVGPLYGRDKYAVMADATCLCLPSHQEGCSVAILEALVSPQAAGDYLGGLPVPGGGRGGRGRGAAVDAGAFAQAMERALVVPAAHQRAEAGRRLIESRYSWSKVAEQTLAAYRQGVGLKATSG